MTAQKKQKGLAVIGCTGSVGSSVMDVCRCYPGEFSVKALAAGSGRDSISALCREFSPERLALTRRRDDIPPGVEVQYGEEALLDLMSMESVDHVVIASSGTAAVKALQRALELGKEVSLANKESALILGDGITQACRSGQLRPLDSEHNALWQCLHGEDPEKVEALFLTASGGPFLRRPLESFDAVTPDMAAAHPVWSMGRKISVDSATMINKGIEILEAHYLFGLPGERIFPVIHPGSRVHGMVTFVDSATKMLLSCPDMRLAALTALAWPQRLPLKLGKIAPPDLSDLDLHFEKPEKGRFPELYTAIEAARAGEPYPVILIAADEAAVGLFLDGKLSFPGIARLVGDVIEGYDGAPVQGLQSRIDLYERAQVQALEFACGRRKKAWN